jgi:outer membrane protein
MIFNPTRSSSVCTVAWTLALLAPSWVPPSARAEPAPLTLPGAMRLLQERSPELERAKLNVDSAELAASNARSAFLPSLDISTTQKAGSPTALSNWSLTATETLWNNGRSWLALKGANLNMEATAAATLEKRESLAAETASRWFEHSRLQALLGIQEEKASLIEKQFSVMKQQFEQGLKTREDFQRIRAQLLRTQAELISTRTQRDQVQVQLLAPLGVGASEAGNFRLQPTIPPPAPTQGWRALLEAGAVDLTNNPTLTRIRAEQEASELDPRQARFDYWPNLDIVGTAGQSGNGPLDGALGATAATPGFQWSAGLSLSWNLWDWGVLRRKITQADIERDRTVADLKRQRLELESQARQIVLDLRRLNEEALLQAEVAQMEEDNFRLVEDNYRRGRTGYLDLITALRDRADARARWQTAYFSAIRTHVQRLQLEGKAHGWLLSFEKNP